MVKENLEEDVTGNYTAFQETWKECLQKIGCCQTQMKTLNYSIFLAFSLESDFSHIQTT